MVEKDCIRTIDEPLVKESSVSNFYLDSLVLLLNQLEVPDVEELKASRVGKVLNKVSKGSFSADKNTQSLASETMSKWKDFYKQKEEPQLKKREAKNIRKKVTFAPDRALNPKDWY